MDALLQDPKPAASPDEARAYVEELLAKQRRDAQRYVGSLVEREAKANPPSVASDIGNAAKGLAKSALESGADTIEGLQSLGLAVERPLREAAGQTRAAQRRLESESGEGLPGAVRGMAGRIPINPKTAAQGGIARFLASDVPRAAGGVLPLLAGGPSKLAVSVLGGAAAHTAAKREGAASGASQEDQDANAYIQTLLGAAAVAGPAGALTRPLGRFGARVAGDFAVGAGQSLIGQAGAKATIHPEAEIDLGEAARSGLALGTVGAGMHGAGKAVEGLRKRAGQDAVVHGMAQEGATLRAEEPKLQATEPLTRENAGQGDAFFDPESGEWRVPVPEAVPSGTPAEAAPPVPRAPHRAAELLLGANKAEGQVVRAPEGSTGHTFAEEFARQHGLDLAWVDAGKELELPGVYRDRSVALDVRGDPISLVYHEAVHALRADDPEAAAKMLGEIHAADPEGFKKHLGEYESEFQEATGKGVPSALRTEEGMARYVERLSGYVTAAFTQPERLRALLEHNPGIVRRIVDKAIALLQKVGVKWKTSQQKALISLRVFARSAGERELKPNRAAELALKIRDSFAAIEGRELPKAEEAMTAAPGDRAQEPSQEQPSLRTVSVEEKPSEPAPKVEAPVEWNPDLAVEEQIKAPEARKHLLSLIPEMGQASRGGEAIFGEPDAQGNKGDIVGRTKWAPRSSWWMQRPGKMPAKLVEKLVRRVTSDKPGKITESQRELLEFLLNQSLEHRLSEFRAQTEEMTRAAEPEAPKAAAGDEEAPFAVKGKGELPERDVLARMSEIMRGRGFEIRGAEDVRSFIEGAKGLDGLFKRNLAWKDAYEQAIGEKAGTFVKPEIKPLPFSNVDMKALKRMGTTSNLREAGYISPTGSLLDFSGKREGGTSGKRALDHRDVGGYAGIQELLSNGYVRIDFGSGAVQLGAIPTPKVEAALLRLFRERNGEIYLDVGERFGAYREKHEQYAEPERGTNLNYDAGTKPEKILGDIRRFYRGEEIRSGPRFAVRGKGATVGFDAPDDTLSAKFRRAIVNDLDRIEITEKAAPKKISGDSLQTTGRLFPGRTFGEVEKLRAQIWKPMKALLRKSKIEPFESKPGEPSASDFLYALAALKANDTLANLHPSKFGTLLNAGSGMSSPDANRIISEALKGPKADAYRELQRLNRSLNTRRLEAWVSGDLITPAQRADLIKKWGLDYVPFRTVEDPTVKLMDVPARSKGFNVRGAEFKKRQGRLDKADSPLAFAFDTAEQALDRKERNRFGLALAKWAEVNQFPHFLRVETDANKIKEGEFRLSYKEKGEQRWLVTKDKGLHDAFKRIAPDPGVLRVFDKALGFLHSTIIRWNPAFPFYNFPKDLGTAAAKVGVEHGVDWSAAVIKNAPYYARGAWKVLRDENAKGKHADLYRDARDAGALVGWNQQFDPTNRLKDFEKAVKRGAIREGASKFFDFIDDANRAVELGTRLAVYDKALRSGKTKSEAAVIARKVTADFAQRGTLSPIFRRLYLFFGAGVQGTREASMAIARHPVRGAAAFGATMAMGYLFASLSRIFADEDENGGSKFDRMSQYNLAHKAGVMVGDQMYGLPLPWFWNVPYYLGVQAEQMLNGERDVRDAVPAVLTSALEAMSPIQGSDPLQAITPTLLRPLEEIATNKDYAGNAIRPPDDPYDKTPTPRSEQAFKDINPALQAAARALNRWTGGNTVRSGAVSISPADMEHVIKFLAGGLGANSWKAMETGRKALKGEDVALADIPVVRAYAARPARNATSALYDRNLRRVLTAAEEVKAGEEPREPKLADLKTFAQTIENSVSKLRRAKKEAQAAGQDVKDLDEALRQLMVSFNRQVMRSGRGSGTPNAAEAASR